MMTKTEHATECTAGSSDTSLVSQTLSGDRDAFGQIVARYQTLICSLAYSGTGSLSQSEDLAQETFLTAYRQLATLREPQKLRAWLCSIARSRICAAFKQQGREPTHAAQPLDTLGANEPPSPEPHPREETITREEQAILWQAVERVPEIYREPLILFYREHGSVETVARDLDLSEDTVKQRLSRGRKLLQEQVTAFVEGALKKTTPSHAFTIGVVAALVALPATLVPAAKAATLGASGSGGAAATTGAGAAGAGAGGVGAILAFMASAKITTAALVAVLLAAGGVSYRVYSERESAASLARARLENMNLAKQLHALEKQDAAARAAALAPAPKPTPQELGQAFMAAHPEIKDVLFTLGKAYGEAATFRIAKALNLSPEQSDKLADIWERYHVFGIGYGTKNHQTMSLTNGADVPTSPADNNEIDTAQRDAELHALLGDANFEKYQHLIKLDSMGFDADAESYQTKELGIRLYLADTPLTSQQAWSIDEIRCDLDQNLPKDTEPQARWKLFQERVKSVLSPEQMKAFADVGDGYVYQQTVAKMMSEGEAKEEAAPAKSKADEPKADESK